MQFLLDSNIFIEAKNRYYSFDICPGFWDWLDKSCGVNVGTVVNVRDELLEGNDDLAKWIKHRSKNPWFLNVDDEDTQREYKSIANYVNNSSYNFSAKEKFLSKADPWLIAKAKVSDAIVITQEVWVGDAKKRIQIPNICSEFNVRYMNTFDVLKMCSVKFHSQ